MKILEGIGQVRVLEEDQQKILRLGTKEGCLSLFRSLTVNLKASPRVSWEWKALTFPTWASSAQAQRDDHGAAVYPWSFPPERRQTGQPRLDIFGTMFFLWARFSRVLMIRQSIMLSCEAGWSS